MRVVVTGGAGFIGANLVRDLLANARVDVVVVDDLSTGSTDNLIGVEVDLRVGSILDRELLSDACAGADAIVHLAARGLVPRSIADPEATDEANVRGTLSVLQTARAVGSPHVIVASSSSIYGRNPVLPRHEDLSPDPLSPYAASKLATEAYARAWAASFGLPVTTFRFFNVFGPMQAVGHDYAAVVPAFVDAALRGVPLPVDGDGTQTRDFTFVDDVTRVLTRTVVERVLAPEPVNLAFGTRRSLLDLIAALSAALGERLEVAHGPRRPGDTDHSQADRTRTEGLFPGLVPTPFVRAMAQTVEWYGGRLRHRAAP